MQKYLSEWCIQFKGKEIVQEDFQKLVKYLGQFDNRCAILDEEAIQVLFEILKEKQDNIVTIEGVQAMVFEFILKDRASLQNSRQRPSNINRISQANRFSQVNRFSQANRFSRTSQYPKQQGQFSQKQQQNNNNNDQNVSMLNPSNIINRPSTFQNPMLLTNQTRTSIIQKNKINENLLQSLTVDKLSEMQYIYNLCDNKKNGEVLYSDIVQKYKEMSISDKDASLALFSLLQNDKQLIIQNTFHSAIAELESILFQNYYQQKDQQQQISYQNINLDVKINEIDENDEYKDNQSDVKVQQPQQKQQQLQQKPKKINKPDNSEDQYYILSQKLIQQQQSNAQQIQNNSKSYQDLCQGFSNLVNQKIDCARQNIKEKKQLLDSLSELAQIMQSFTANIFGMEKDFQSFEKKISDLEIENELYRNKASFQESEVKRITEQYDQLAYQFDILAEELNEKQYLQQTYDKKLSCLEDLKQEKASIETDYRILQKQNQQLQQQLVELQNNYKQNQEKLDIFVNEFYKNQENQDNNDNDSGQEDEDESNNQSELNLQKQNSNKKKSKYHLREIKLMEKENEQLKANINTLNEQLEQQKMAMLRLEDQMENAIEQLQNQIKLYEELKLDNEILGLRTSKLNGQNQRISQLTKQSSNKSGGLGGRMSFLPRTSQQQVDQRISWNLPNNSNCNQEGENQNQQMMFIEQEQSPNNNNDDYEQREEFKAELKQTFADFWDNVIKKQPSNQINQISEIKRDGDSENEDSDNENNDGQGKKKKHSEKAPVQYRFLEFDEEKLFARDYMNLREDDRISTMLKKYAKVEAENMLSLTCFSDSVFRINSNGKRDRRVLFITYYNIYFLDGTQNLKLLRLIPLEKIEKITFSETSANLCVIHVKFQHDLLLESYRRTEMNLFLLEALKERNLPFFEIKFCNEFKIRFREEKTSINTNFEDKYSLKNFQGAYKDAIKVGFLEVFQDQNFFKKMFKDPWKEVFLVLDKIGLLLFEESGSMHPILFIPISGMNICINPQINGIDKKFIIKIFSNDFTKEFIFAAKSKPEQIEWYDQMHKIMVLSLNSNAVALEQTTYSIAESTTNEHEIKTIN